jgi:predicted ribosome quality control (RQC) complex YloA/Tae2 family protein
LPEPGVLLPLSLEPDPPAAQACLAALVREERARRAALLLREKKRLERLLAHVDEDLARFEVLERERHAAELLKGQLQRVSRGMAEVELEDWYADPPGAVLKLALDPALSPVENMEKIFRRAARSARGKTEAARRREEVLAALVRLETSSRLLEGVPGEDAAGLLAFPMPGIGKTAQPSRGRKAAGGHPAAGGEPFRRIPVGGALCLVGKSALGNETVSFREAAGRDLWFHTHNYPGSHVLLKRPNRAYAFSDGEIALAAQLALHYSQARDKGPEEVVMVEARFLRRVPGKRGAVTYASPRVLKVDPDPEALRRLRNPGT